MTGSFGCFRRQLTFYLPVLQYFLAIEAREENVIGAGEKMPTILLLEDEESVNRGIEFTLKKEGFDVFGAGTIREARGILAREDVSLMICDINLPDGSGLDFIRQVRQVSQAHIICLTALDQEIDQVIGYEAGADDYMVKPFSLSVLALKVQAYFRKHSQAEGQTVTSGDLQVSLPQMRVWKRGQEISLTKNEWKMLCLFLEHPRQILSKNQMLEQLFDNEGDFVDANTLAVNIRRLREKIEDDSKSPSYIKNIRGMGYFWDQACTQR